jgi:hypothetical protein
MKNLRIKVTESCSGRLWDFDIYDGKTRLMSCYGIWERKYAAIRNAKAMAKKIGIKYDPEIVKLHGC